MKIKHWQGYGLINAHVIKKSHINGRYYIDIEVSGNHEYGLDRSDSKYDVFHWLNKVMKNKDLKKALTFTGPDAYNFYQWSECVFMQIYDLKDTRDNYLQKGIYHLEFNDLAN